MEAIELKYVIDKLKNSTIKKEENRGIWKESTKQLILDCFNEIIKKFDIGLEIGGRDGLNLDCIYMRFIQKQSDFLYFDERETVQPSKIGGVLHFSQTFNGEILVKIVYPIIDKVKPIKDNLIITTLPPSKITKALVVKYVEDFLKEMVDWESNNE